MISFKDFETEEGGVDWGAYYKAQQEAGEKCFQCGAHIYPAKGYKASCDDCNGLTDSGEIYHASIVRCPKCENNMDVFRCDDGLVYTHNDIEYDGEHEVTCDECGYEFDVMTFVTYEFKSPALVKEDVQENEEV